MQIKIRFPFLVILHLAASHAAYGAATEVISLERSTNRNRVIYEVDSERKDPVRVFWRMLESDGHVEELTSIERSRFYGVDVQERSIGKLVFSFRSLPKIPIEVRFQGGIAVATVQILGNRCDLKKIFLRMSKGIFPSVKSIEFGCSGTENQEQLVTYDYFPDREVWERDSGG